MPIMAYRAQARPASAPGCAFDSSCFPAVESSKLHAWTLLPVLRPMCDAFNGTPRRTGRGLGAVESSTAAAGGAGTSAWACGLVTEPPLSGAILVESGVALSCMRDGSFDGFAASRLWTSCVTAALVRASADETANLFSPGVRCAVSTAAACSRFSYTAAAAADQKASAGLGRKCAMAVDVSSPRAASWMSAIAAA